MTAEAPDISEEELLGLLASEYGLDIASITFVPKGEEAYSYVAKVRDSGRVFVRVQESARADLLETAFEVAYALSTQCELREVLAPVRSHAGEFTSRFEGYSIAVFPYVDGNSAYEVGLSDDGLRRVASLIAAIHSRGSSLSLSKLYQESFDNPFAAPIDRAFEAIERLTTDSSEYQRRVRDLLRAERDDILAVFDRMEQLRAEIGGLDVDFVLTHGDPNVANILIDECGELSLVDWGDVGLGPPEQDLMAFSEDRFEIFLRQYAADFGRPKLHEPVFAFYFYRWVLQEIADYTTRILRNTTARQDEHAWSCLTPYLPVPHAEIQAGLRNVIGVISKVVGPLEAS